MKTCFIAVAVAFFALTVPNHASAQQAIVKSTATLRLDPSTIDPPEATLHSGDKLTILDPTPEHGYYQVKTEDGVGLLAQYQSDCHPVPFESRQRS